MGKQNRQRRAAKRRDRESRARDTNREPRPAAARGTSAWREPASPVAIIRNLLLAAAQGDRGAAIVATRELQSCEPTLVAHGAEELLLQELGWAWANGWQPAEIARRVRRTSTGPAARLALHAIAADHAVRPATTIDPRWLQQLDLLDLPAEASDRNWLRRFAGDGRIDWTTAIVIVVDLLQALSSIGALPIILPPPGSADAGRIDLTSPVDDPILARVRALLAQAESTSFEAEAETFTSKAQELMTRHAIDEALLDARAARSDAPITLRVAVDDPYADAKSLLAHKVASQTRCRAVYDDVHALVSIVGLARDVAACEVLFTSLLVQASTAMHAAAAGASAGARTRSRGFRSSFWLAYAMRVGERLAEINQRIMHEVDADFGGALVPVLAKRQARVDQAVDTMFGPLRTTSVRGSYDGAGWASGRAAADTAQLNAGAVTT